MSANYLVLILILFALGIMTAMITVVTMAVALLRPPRMTDGKAVWVLRRMSPGDLGLVFEEVGFDVRDEQAGQRLKIAGWWIPSANAAGHCVVMLHGYADAKVGVIAWAPLWNSLGFNVLAIDLRAHGESGGVYCTAGYWERGDLNQVINQLRAERPDDTRQVALFGVSLGAATAAATAATRDDLSAVVLESPPADFRTAAMAHMDQLGAPGRLFQKMSIALAARLARCDFQAVRSVDLLKKINSPVMIISQEDDPMVDQDQRRAMREAFDERPRSGADVYWTLMTGHMLALHTEGDEYQKKLFAFLQASGHEIQIAHSRC